MDRRQTAWITEARVSGTATWPTSGPSVAGRHCHNMDGADRPRLQR